MSSCAIIFLVLGDMAAALIGVSFGGEVASLKLGREGKKSVEGSLAMFCVCVEINQCVGCTRQFFTKSFLGDDAAVLAQSSGEEPASPRHRAGVASMAWRTTR